VLRKKRVKYKPVFYILTWVTMKPCLKHGCFRCCINTDMILLTDDIERIKRIGYDPSYFCVMIDGYYRLTNKDGRCIFHDGRLCRIYKDRPIGCRLYPIVYQSDTGKVIKDEECPYRNEFPLSYKKKRLLLSVVDRIQKERMQRI